jgi:NDP-sugar pyrophosphorylase family protein
MFDLGVVLAAGRGSRMGNLTESVPKPLLPSLDYCLLGNQLDFIRPAVKSLCVTAGYKGDQVASFAIQEGADFVLNTHGKGNASWVKTNLIKNFETVLIITCDNIMKMDLGVVEEEIMNCPSQSFIVPMSSQEEWEGDRLEVDQLNKVTSIGRGFNSKVMATGLQILRLDMLENRDVDDFSQVWSQLIQKGALSVTAIEPTDWFPVDNESQLKQFEKEILKSRLNRFS